MIIIIIIFNIYIAHFSYGYDQMHITNKYSFQQLRVLDSPQQWPTYIYNPTIALSSSEDRPQHRDHYPALSDKCVGSLKSLDRVSRDWAYGLTSLSEKMQKSNCLQMLEQRQHFLLNYFKTLSVGPAGNRTRASHTLDWHLTN